MSGPLSRIVFLCGRRNGEWRIRQYPSMCAASSEVLYYNRLGGCQLRLMGPLVSRPSLSGAPQGALGHCLHLQLYRNLRCPAGRRPVTGGRVPKQNGGVAQAWTGTSPCAMAATLNGTLSANFIDLDELPRSAYSFRILNLQGKSSPLMPLYVKSALGLAAGAAP